jgi:hypothetical protein
VDFWFELFLTGYIALASGWFLHRNYAKPKITVRIGRSAQIAQHAETKSFQLVEDPTFLVTVTSHGPNLATIIEVVGQDRSTKKAKMIGTVAAPRPNEDGYRDLKAAISERLEPSDQAAFHVPNELVLELKKKLRVEMLGVRDSFDRIHWAEKTSINKAAETFYE